MLLLSHCSVILVIIGAQCPKGCLGRWKAICDRSPLSGRQRFLSFLGILLCAHVSSPNHHGHKHLALMVDRMSAAVLTAVDLFKGVIRWPLPPRIGTEFLGALVHPVRVGGVDRHAKTPLILG